MRWNKYTLTTTAEAEDMISSMMMEAGIEGIEIEDKVPLSESDKSQMFVDILPEGPADDGVARTVFIWNRIRIMQPFWQLWKKVWKRSEAGG